METLATIDDVKRSLGITAMTYDAALTGALAQVSRLVTAAAGRRFLPWQATRYLDGDDTSTLWLPETVKLAPGVEPGDWLTGERLPGGAGWREPAGERLPSSELRVAAP